MNIMTWSQMKNTFPDEWLLITDYQLDGSGHLLSGYVERHAKDKESVYKLPVIGFSTAFRYTGESTFSGLRHYGHHQNNQF
ncbi:MAG: hypothetical protein ACI8WB_000460 [Phenylobacterium sp.]|jgi:hypothetical protein